MRHSGFQRAKCSGGHKTTHSRIVENTAKAVLRLDCELALALAHI
jgi:hypothetical protein